MALHMIRCAGCSEPFQAARSDAETCSGRCRERRRKARAEARQTREIEHAAEVLASLRTAAALTPED